MPTIKTVKTAVIGMTMDNHSGTVCKRPHSLFSCGVDITTNLSQHEAHLLQTTQQLEMPSLLLSCFVLVLMTGDMSQQQIVSRPVNDAKCKSMHQRKHSVELIGSKGKASFECAKRVTAE